MKKSVLERKYVLDFKSRTDSDRTRRRSKFRIRVPLGIIIFSTMDQKWVCVRCTTSWDELGHQKTPEMSELEADKYAVKI